MLENRVLKTASEALAAAKGLGLEATPGNKKAACIDTLREDMTGFVAKPMQGGASNLL